MSTSTNTTAYTIAHTATYLSEAIFAALVTLLDHLGVGASGLARSWESDYAPAIRAWMNERTLKEVVLECTTPGGTVQRFDFAIDYTSDSGTFRNRAQTLVSYYSKLTRLPAGTTWRIVCRYHSWHTPQPGWSSTTLNEPVGVAMSLGTLARAPHGTVALKTYGS